MILLPTLFQTTSIYMLSVVVFGFQGQAIKAIAVGMTVWGLFCRIQSSTIIQRLVSDSNESMEYYEVSVKVVVGRIFPI